jgi:thymidylate synthase (FAD)
MAHKTEIGIFKIAQTRINWRQLIAWLKFIGVPEEKLKFVVASLGHNAEEYPLTNPYPESGTSASALCAAAGKRCYKSFTTDLNPNVSRIREDHAEYLTNVLKSGHGSVFEHVSWTFAIENISRVFTGEMNRHRAGTAISEGSMRYIRYDDIGFWMPDSLTGDSQIKGFVEQKEKTAELLGKAFEQMEAINIDLGNIWKIDEMTDFSTKKKLTSLFRRIIGMGIATGGVWTMNARALRHILTMRANNHAEEEIYHVFSRIADIMVKDEPLLFGDFEKDEKGNWAPKFVKV